MGTTQSARPRSPADERAAEFYECAVAHCDAEVKRLYGDCGLKWALELRRAAPDKRRDVAQRAVDCYFSSRALFARAVYEPEATLREQYGAAGVLLAAGIREAPLPW